MQTAWYVVKRLFTMLVTICVIIAVSYILMYLSPGSFFSVATIASAMSTLEVENPKLYQEYINSFLSRYGLNQPLWHQVLQYVWHSITFNFGNSFTYPTVPIINQLKTAFPISAELAFGAVVLGVVVGIPLGILAALYRNTWVDSVLTSVSMIGQAIPAFVTAVFMVLIFGVYIPGVLPINGWGTPQQAILPILALGLGNIGVVTRYMRGSLIETLRQDYMRTAEAKGVKYWSRILRHGVRNSLVALMTVIGPAFGFTVVSTVWVENIFSIPGLGSLMATAFVNKDVPLAITDVFILALLILVTNFLVDIGYSILDPRVHLT
ncbi:MAG: ABC transporter permease [Firmicutes bacterium]|nr:ABC transporter permease [Bacillota bacterium]